MSLLELADLCEKLAGPDREMDEAICLAMNPKQTTRHIHTNEIINVPEFTRLVDVALRVNPGWFWRAGSGAQEAGWAHLNKHHLSHCDRGDEVHATAATPPLAICAAALRARHSLAVVGDAGK